MRRRKTRRRGGGERWRPKDRPVPGWFACAAWVVALIPTVVTAWYLWQAAAAARRRHVDVTLALLAFELGLLCLATLTTYLWWQGRGQGRKG